MAADVEGGRALTAWVDLPTREAIDFFRSKRLVGASTFGKLEQRYTARAFAVAGLQRGYLLDEVHGVITTALEEGVAQGEAVKRMQAAFDSVGVTGKGRHHLDLVFRNGTEGAYAAGRWAQMRAAVKRRPYWRYRTVGDHRVRPAHRAQDGKVYPADHPFWSEWYPPNGHACRCQVESLSAADVEREGHEVLDAMPPADQRPDKGWEGSPASEAETDAAIERVRRAARSLPTLEAPRLASKGKAPFASAGDLGAADAARKAAVVDKLAGLSPAEAVALAARGPVSLAQRLVRVAGGATEVVVPIPSQYLDGAEQLVARLARSPELGRLAKGVRVSARASYAAGEVTGRPELVVGGGLTRGTELVLAVQARGAAAAALALVALQAEAGHGAPIRRALEVAPVMVRGALPAVEGYREAWLCWRPGPRGRVEMRLTVRPLSGYRAERVLVTEAQAKELAKR